MRRDATVKSWRRIASCATGIRRIDGRRGRAGSSTARVMGECCSRQPDPLPGIGEASRRSGATGTHIVQRAFDGAAVAGHGGEAIEDLQWEHRRTQCTAARGQQVLVENGLYLAPEVI